MGIKIDAIEYVKGDENFESEEIKIISQKFHEELGSHKEPNDTVETVTFEANTEHGIITGQATARRSGYDIIFELEDIEISIDDKEIDITTPVCTIEDDEEIQ
ncbi:MAG: hypothetical protein KAJ49_06440 [Arcobacteraceae bacterium]|nr:hypothetical protein [Arcobacteraceae bacterium]